MTTTIDWKQEAFDGLILREEWSKGKKNIGRLGNPMVLPVKYVIIHHSVTPIGTSAIDGMWKVNDVGIQRFGMHSYSFNFWPDVTGHLHRVLQGQGGRKGAHSGAAWNAKALGMCWIGNYEKNVPGHQTIVVTASMLRYTAAWIGYLIDNGVVAPDVKIMHHSQIKATACPGDYWVPEMVNLQKFINDGYRLSDYHLDFFPSVLPTPAPTPTPTPPPVKATVPSIPDPPVVPSAPQKPTVEEAKTLFDAVVRRVAKIEETIDAHGDAIGTHTQELAAFDNAVVKLQNVTLNIEGDTHTIATLANELSRRIGILESKSEDNIDAIMAAVAARLTGQPTKEQEQ